MERMIFPFLSDKMLAMKFAHPQSGANARTHDMKDEVIFFSPIVS